MSEETITKITGDDKQGENVSRLGLYNVIFNHVNNAYDPDNLSEVQRLYTNWSGYGVPVAHLADIIITKNPELVSLSDNAIAKQIVKDVNEYIERVFGLKILTDVEAKKITSIFPEIKSETIRSWLNTNGKKPGDNSRIALYMISFAYDLPYDENWNSFNENRNTVTEIDENGELVFDEPLELSHQYLFSHIFRMKPLIKTPLEFCLTYCKYKKLEICDAYKMYSEYLKKIPESGNKTVGGTRTLFTNLFGKNENEFIDELCGTKLTIMPDKVKEQINTNLKTKDGKNMYFGKLWSNANKKDSPLYISFESAFRKSSGQTGNIIQLRKILILSFYYRFYFTNENIYKADERTFKFFIKSLDRELSRLNLPELYILDDFDRAVIISAAALKKQAVIISAAAPKDQDAVDLFDIIAEVVPPEML